LFDFKNPIVPGETDIFQQFSSDSPLTLLLLIYGKTDNEEFLSQKEIIEEANNNQKNKLKI
jgi:hypothetical protein